MPLRYALLGLGWLISLASWAGGIRGTLYDQSGQPLPFATVYVAGTSQGATSNAQGDYELSLPPGTYPIVFQYVGYVAKTQEVTIEGDEWVELNLRLAAEVLTLPEVVVNARDEDPAYPIMRQAIAWRKYFRQEVASYSGKTYVKGKGELIDYPKLPIVTKKLRENGIDTGVVFLTESVAEVTFRQPDQYQENVIALKVTGSDELTPINRTTRINFYEPLVARAVSPLADNAFAHYTFALQGSFQDGDHTIHKIQVTPKRRKARAFRGTLYIVEGRWNLHSLDLTLPAPTMTHHLRQVFAPVQEGVWMPLNHQLTTQGYALVMDLFRVDFKFQYASVQSEYRLTLNPDRFRYQPSEAVVVSIPDDSTAVADTVADAPTTRKASAKELMAKARALQRLKEEAERETREERARPPQDLTIQLDSVATKRDSTFWETYRPVPLTLPEQKGYRVQDSIQAVREDPFFRDSVEAQRNRWRWASPLTGYQYRKHGSPWTVSFSGLASGLQFNTVEGWVLEPSLTLRRELSRQRQLTFSPQARYGFAAQRGYGQADLSYAFRPQRPASLALAGGRYVAQLNPAGAIAPWLNTLTTLLQERNWMRLYAHTFAEARYATEWVNGVYMEATARWEARETLMNQAAFRLIDSPRRAYTSNAPTNLEIGEATFTDHRALVGHLSVRYVPNQKYMIRNGRKRVLDTDQPTFQVEYRRGMSGWLGSAVDYDFLSASVAQTFPFRRAGLTRYLVRGGAFLSHEAVYFPDFYHFQGNQTLLRLRERIDNFHLLPYYAYSTRDRFVEAHVEHRFSRLLLARVPLIGLLDWREVALVNYLYTPTAGHYTEIGLGIDDLFQLLRIDFVAGFRGTAYQQFGVRLGLAFRISTGN